MVGKVAQRRSEEIRVKLSPDLAAEFSTIAGGRGLLPATLAAVALGEYVERYRREASVQRMVALDMSKRMSELSMSEEGIAKAIASALGNPEVVSIIASMGPEAGPRA